MEIIYNRSRECLIVRLKGELDDHAAGKLRQTLKESFRKKMPAILLLNLQELDFMDSSGVGVILGRYRETSRNNNKLMLCGLNPQVKRVLDLAGVLKIVPAYKTEREALRQGRVEK